MSKLVKKFCKSDEVHLPMRLFPHSALITGEPPVRKLRVLVTMLLDIEIATFEGLQHVVVVDMVAL